MGLFTAWLRQPADNVVLLAGAEPRRAASTVNRMLSGMMGFYDFHARHGVEVARALVDRSRSGRGSYKPFLDGIAPARDRARVGRLHASRRPPRTLSLEQVAAVLDAQRRLRDRFLFALLFGTGMRIGQALGLRHVWSGQHDCLRADNGSAGVLRRARLRRILCAASRRSA